MLSQFFQLAVTLSLILSSISVISCTTSTPQSQSIQSPSEQQKQLVGSRINNQDTARAFDRLRTRGLRDHEDIDLNRLEPGEVCVINVNEADARKLDEFAQARGYTKKKRRILNNLGFVMSIFHAPPGQSLQEAILAIQEAFPSQIIDANHHYYLQEQTLPINPLLYGHRLVGWTDHAIGCVIHEISIGMIDTAVNMRRLPAKQRTIHTKSFIPPNASKPQDYHGTAVATLLVGQAHTTNHALLPQASLFVAEAFRQKEAGKVEATTWSIVRALDWLVEQHVQVINLSLGGPPNALLSYAITTTLNQSIPIVAAGGNAGPDGHPIYPAAQPGVIAVTALDAKLHPYRYANRGSYISFSAPGVDIWIPQEGGTGAFQSGTSFATPFVTTATAAVKQLNPHWTPDQIVYQLARTAVDLGTTGKDETFGWGLIQIPHTCPNTSSSLHTQSSSMNPDSKRVKH